MDIEENNLHRGEERKMGMFPPRNQILLSNLIPPFRV